MKALRVIKRILCLAFLVFLVLCAFTPIQPGAVWSGEIEGEPAERGSSGFSFSIPFLTKNVELSSGSYRETTESLTAVLTPGETAALDKFTQLRRADFSGSANIEEIRSWAAAHPGVDVTWSVTLPDGRSVGSKAGEIDLSGGDITQLPQIAPLLKDLPAVRTVLLGTINSGAEQLAAFREAAPGVQLNYTVSLRGQTLTQDTTSVDLTGATAEELAAAAQVLPLLPALKNIELGTFALGTYSSDQLTQLVQSAPGAALNYTMEVFGQVVGQETESLDLSTASLDQIQSVAPLLSSLPNLKLVHLGAAGGAVDWAGVWTVASACPNAVLDYACNVWGVDVNLSDAQLNLSHVPMNDEGEIVASILPLMRSCTTVDMDSCGVSNTAMRAIRDANPGKNIIWRVWFGTNYSVRTDVIKILASKPSKGGPITNADVEALSCCTKLKYLDIGHNDQLTDCSFFYYMPDIEVVIVTLTGISDITPLSACPHLEYLEVTHTGVSDLSPLANATELRHLNIGDTQVHDITPLYGLTEMERLFICLRHHVPQDQIDEMQRRAPNCLINVDQDDPSLGAWRYADLTDRGWKAFVESGYQYFEFDNHPRYELLRQQFGYANEEYAFYWLDPLY